MGPPPSLVYIILLLNLGGIFFWGFLLGRWRRKKLGLALAFLPYIYLDLTGVISIIWAVQMGWAQWDSDLLGGFLGSQPWNMMIYLIPALVGYLVGFVLSRRKRALP